MSFRHFLPIQLFLLRAFVKNVAARCDFQARNIPICVCGRGFAPHPTGEAYTAPTGPIAAFQGAGLWHGRGGEGGKEERGKGSVPPLLFFTI